MYEIPSYDNLERSTLNALHALGGQASNDQITIWVIEDLSILPHVAKIPHTRGSNTELEYRLAWARTKLKNRGLIYNSGRAMWSLTELGRSHEIEVINNIYTDYSDIASKFNFQPNTELVDENIMPNNEGIVNSLKAEIQLLEGQKRKIDGNIRTLTETLRYYQNQNHSPQTLHLEENSADSPTSMRDIIYKILKHERPLHRKDIYERILQKGFQVGGKTPINTVGAHLSSDDRFKSLGNGVWDIADQSNYELDIGIYKDTDDDTLDVPW